MVRLLAHVVGFCLFVIMLPVSIALAFLSGAVGGLDPLF